MVDWIDIDRTSIFDEKDHYHTVYAVDITRDLNYNGVGPIPGKLKSSSSDRVYLPHNYTPSFDEVGKEVVATTDGEVEIDGEIEYTGRKHSQFKRYTVK